MSFDNKSIELKIENALNKKIVDNKVTIDNPIYALMKSSAEKIAQKYGVVSNDFLFYFVSDNNINAYTLCIDNHNVICFTTGAMFHIGYTLEKMLHNESFKEHFIDLDESKILAQISVYFYCFLLYHEFAHLIFGHCKYLENKYAMRFMAAFDNKRKDTLIDIQTLELHADITAARIFKQIIEIDNPKVKIEQIIVSLVTLFNFMYLYDKSYDYKNKTYLPPSERLSLVLSIVFSNCLSKKEISSSIKKMYNLSNDAFYDIFRINNELNKKMSYRYDIDSHLISLSNNWSIIYKELLRFSYLPIGDDIYE